MASKTPAASLIQVPARFSIVEQGVYRCASPTGPQVAFLQSLGLRTIISLTPEHPTRQLVGYARATGVDFVHLGTTLFQPLTDWRPITDEIVKTALELILDVRSHPVLVIDPLGIHQTGIVFGCLRVMQGWNFASALSEYRAHSGPTKHRYCDETYIELFDPDLINLPPNHCLPLWWNDGEDEDGDDGWVEQDPPPKEKKKKKDKGEGGEKEKDKEKEEEKKEEERTEERKEDEKREKKQEERILRAEEREEAEAGLVNGIEAAAAADAEAARPNGGAAHPGGMDGGVG